MARFSIDLEGRVKNFDLKKSKPLLPLFEAVVNSIYAIEERQKREEFEGVIDVRIIREPQEVVDGVSRSINDIVGFEVVDNGIGFDTNNMKSFLQSDSTYRADKGGKGIGRFSWLKAFKEAIIEIVFQDDDGSWVKREFSFILNNQEIDDTLIDVYDNQNYETKVLLKNYYADYQKNVPKSAEKIANSLMQHCLIYLMGAKCPRISVIDEERICVNYIFEKMIERENNPEKIEVGGQQFLLLNTKVYDGTLGGSKLFLYADDRMVKAADLDKEIPNLDKNVYEEEGFYYVGLLSGKYLDNNVDSNRTSFTIDDTESGDELSLDTIIKETAKYVENYLAEYLEKVKEQKNERIRRYIATEAPQFGHLLQYMPGEIELIKPTVKDSKLDEELYRIKRKFDLELKTKNKELIDKFEADIDNTEEYKAKFQNQIEKISDANKAALTEYVAHRRIILDFLSKGIRKKEDGKFNLESYIHNLIYPMRRTSEEIDYRSHNLWLIDERLSYCDYISSDIPFNNDNREQRTDIMFLDQPVAVSDEQNTGREYECITIIELKRPMRDDYKPGENPIDQLLGYEERIMTNTLADKEGRPIRVGQNTRFYLYAVCDIMKSLRSIADRYDFHETPDKMGMYRYNDNAHAYMEIISFNKLIADSEKRNKILFDKLGI